MLNRGLDMTDEIQPKTVMIDAEAASYDRKKEGAALLLPSKTDKPDAIDFITQLGGKRSNLYKLYQVRVHEKGLVAMAENPPRRISMKEMQECAEFILLYSQSLDAMRSKQVVEILKSEVHEPPPSMLEAAIGRFRKS